jgi:phosphopantetheinyl transferase
MIDKVYYLFFDTKIDLTNEYQALVTKKILPTGINSLKRVNELVLSRLMIDYVFEDNKINLNERINEVVNGKPLFHHNLNFSITHSYNFIAVAVSNEMIGIDAEVIRNYDKRLLTKICDNNEQLLIGKALTSSNNPNQLFYTVWTIKEAVSKYYGLGLSCNYKEIKIINGLDNDSELVVKTDDKEFKPQVETIDNAVLTIVANHNYKVKIIEIEDFIVKFALS